MARLPHWPPGRPIISMNAIEEKPPGTEQPAQSKDCPHLNFEAQVDVNRLTEKEGGPVTKWAADIRIRCADCGAECHFVGVDQGLSFRRPMCSADGTELRAPIAIGKVPASPVQTFEVTGEAVTNPDPVDAPGVGESDEEFIRRAEAQLRKGDHGQ